MKNLKVKQNRKNKTVSLRKEQLAKIMGGDNGTQKDEIFE